MFIETKDLSQRYRFAAGSRDLFLDRVEAELARQVAERRADQRATTTKGRPRPRPITPLRAVEARLAAAQAGTCRLAWLAAADGLTAAYARLAAGVR